MKKREMSLDNKVYGILSSYLGSIGEDHEEALVQQGLDNEKTTRIAQDLLKVLRKLRVQEAVDLCQRSDVKLQRVKKMQMTAAVEKAMGALRRDVESRLSVRDETGDDEPFDRINDDEAEIMEVKNMNQLNKSVVDLWNIQPATSNIPSALPSGAASPLQNTGNGSVPPPPTGTVAAAANAVLANQRVAAESSVDAGSGSGSNSAPTAKTKSKSKKSKIETRPQSEVTLADLGGIETIISQVLEMIAMPLSHPEIYTQIGSSIPRGVLLHGPPGCGKTMLANALANELGVPFISVSAPSIVSGMSGESEKKLRDIFEEAKSVAPCLIFIDEIDAITPKRESAQREMERRIVAQLLTCMDDVALDKTDGRPIMVIGATNRPDAIDAALRRGGRFDREICMSVPDQECRERILTTISQKLKLSGDFDFKELARLTPGYVGADLNALVAAAGVIAIKRIFRDLNVMGQQQSVSKSEGEEDASMIDANDHSTDVVNGEQRSEIRRFLDAHPDPLNDQELAPLFIVFDDFLNALPQVQPSSKREGFATVPDVSWNDVGAMAAVREELEYAIVEPIKNPEVFETVGITAPSGVLLWGPPGCGKTLLAKAVANESQANFISVRGPELLNKYVGESERAVRQVFVRARASVPCVIFFDELDALVPHRDDSNSEASSRVVNTLLTELDGVGDRNGVYVIAATNRPDMIDSAMLRPGRLDKQLYVDLPTAADRAEILQTVSRKSPLSPEIDLHQLSSDERCRNFSGADLSALVREAAVVAIKEHLKSRRAGKVVITMDHFQTALEKVNPSVSDLEREKYKSLNDQWGK